MTQNGGKYGNRSEWRVWCGPDSDFRGTGSGTQKTWYVHW